MCINKSIYSHTSKSWENILISVSCSKVLTKSAIGEKHKIIFIEVLCLWICNVLISIFCTCIYINTVSVFWYRHIYIFCVFWILNTELISENQAYM